MSSKNPDSQHPAPTECLATMAGYRDVPTIRDSLRFQLPTFSIGARRYVSVGTKAWELWSPNSPTHAFYPGIRQVAPNFATRDNPRLLHADGHLGKFDATLIPQMFDPRQPWLPLIRKTAEPATKYPEHTPFLKCWDPERRRLMPSSVQLLTERSTALQKAVGVLGAKSSNLGEWWKSKPTAPSHSDVWDITKKTDPVEIRLAYAALQRAMKVTSAWCKFAQLHLDVARDQESLMEGPIRPAHEQFIGLWINGCALETAVWYLRIKVPCFIVHTVDTFSDRHWVLKANTHHPTQP